MADFLTINSDVYGVEITSCRGRWIQIENRTPVLTGDLNVDRIATRREITVEINKKAGVPLSLTAGNTLMAALAAADVTVGGDITGGSSFTAAARDIGHRDIVRPAGHLRFVTVTLEETEA